MRAPRSVATGPARPSARASRRSSACCGPVDVAFVAEAATVASITPRGLARVHGAYYSVPCRWAGLDLTGWIGATTVTIVGRDGQRITHPRQRFGERSIDYRHFLPELARKPQAVRQVLPELLRDLGPPFPAVWARLAAQHGPREAARHFARILGQLETHGDAVVVPALHAALAAGTPLALALTPATAPASASPRRPSRPRSAHLEIGSGVAADYDAWLQGGAA